MGAPTAITVSVDRTEYSRYETGRDTVSATVVIQGGAIYSSEEVLVELVKARRGRDAVVATITLSFSGNEDPQEGLAEFYIPDIVDQDLINLVRHGRYFVRASSVTTPTVIGESPDFNIKVVTSALLKSDYLFGINLLATEVLAPKFQPTAITGVTIDDVSLGHPVGFHTLTYNYHLDPVTNATASIGSGANGTVNITAEGAVAGDAGNAVAVQVLVPASGTTPLLVSFDGVTLTVQLAVNAGVLDNAANTATLVAAAIDSDADFSATASGSGVDPLTAAEGPTLFSGGTTNTIRNLSWNGGTAVSITKAGTYILPRGESGPKAACEGGSTADYICVTISSLLLLPTQNVTESILVQKKKIDDETLCMFIDKATAWVENQVIAGFVEPTNVVTDRDPTTIQFAAGINAPTPLFTDTDYDFLVSPLTYFVPRTTGSWVQIQTPYPQLLRVDSLFGAIANTRVIDIDLEWIEVAQQGGLIQLVPFNQEIAFDFVGLIWVNALRGAAELPNFWHFNIIAGLRDCPDDLRELIAKKAAIDALTIAGMALRPGVGSMSLSRDGVNQSISYINSAEFGIYTGTINAYKQWIDDHLKDVKGKYRGPTMVVV